jgi:hypothetical protein
LDFMGKAPGFAGSRDDRDRLPTQLDRRIFCERRDSDGQIKAVAAGARPPGTSSGREDAEIAAHWIYPSPRFDLGAP